jgi:hypothetical protein
VLIILIIFNIPENRTYWGKVGSPMFISIVVKWHAEYHNPRTTPSGRKETTGGESRKRIILAN